MTMANAPLWDGTAGDIEVIWVKREAEYFCKRGWTGFTDLPVGGVARTKMAPVRGPPAPEGSP
jgi:hypothetical protein